MQWQTSNGVKIAVFETKEWEKEYLKNQLKDLEPVFFAEKFSLENTDLAKDCDIISVFVESQISQEVLQKLPNVKMIATRSTGFDHINVKACKEKNIIVCNVPHYGDNTVAEHAFALMLDLSRKIYDSIEKVKKEGFSVRGLTGFDLKGKTLGIIGLGNIGQHVARIAKGFEMKVLGYDIMQDKKLAKKLGFTYAPFEDVLKNSDIITLHVSYNEHTHHLINSSNVNVIKKGAYIINTSRGGVIETAALVDALHKGILAGAGLDVLEGENVIREEAHLLSKDFSKPDDIKTALQDHILMELPNVIITPHNAFNSKEASEKILETTVVNIQGFMKGKLVNTVL